MCDQTEVLYKEGDVVWVKLGSYFWPGEVQDVDKLDEEILVSFKKKPIAAVKFFDEDKYEYVKNLNQICFYNCRKKHDYIKKGLDMYRRQKEGSYMDKFPDDVRKAEIRTGGNPNILSDEEFQPQEKPNYQALFGSDKKGKQGSPKQTSLASTNGRKNQSVTPVRNPPRLITITHPRFIKGETEHKIHIRQQPSPSPESRKSPPAPPTAGSAAYKCHLCDFTSNRLNVIVLHNKFHSANTQTDNDNIKSKGSASKSRSPSVKGRSGLSSTEAKSKLKNSPKEPDVLKSTSPTTPVTTHLPKSKRKALEEDVGEEDIGHSKSSEPDSPERKRTKAGSSDSPEKKKSSAVISDSPEKKPKTPEKAKVTTKSPVLGKRKGSRGEDKVTKKVKNDEEIREKLLADWDDEDAEQEEKEMELLKQQLKSDVLPPVELNDGLNTTINSDDNKTGSCFDFDDSKDAILANELEERAKKFVENRKVPKVADEKVVKHGSESPTSVDSTSLRPGIESEDAAGAEDFNNAITTLLAETEVPQLPEIPVANAESCNKSSNILPDVVLDSNLATSIDPTAEDIELQTATDFKSGDHDYSAKQKDEATSENIPTDFDILDINSMPVVMADAIISSEPSTSQVPIVNIQMPKIDLIPNPNVTNTHTIVMTDGRLAMSPSVQSVVKAVRSSSIDRSKTPMKTVVSVSQVSGGTAKTTNKSMSNISKGQSTEKLTPCKGARLLQQGIASGKYVIVQPAGTAQSRLTQKPNTPQQVANLKPTTGSSQQQMTLQTPASGKVVIITKPQSGSQQQLLTALTPAQQKALVAGGKLPSPPQRLLTSTGQLLTPVNPRNVMAKGTKLTPVPGQQIRTLASGKQTLGPKLQMQSLQTKIVLPTMETVKTPQTQPQPVVRMVSTGKTQPSTILIQATEGSPMLSSIVSRVSASSTQLTPKPVAQPKQQRPRLLTSATMLSQAAGQPTTNAKVQPTRQTFQPRMLVQKSRPALLSNSKNNVQVPKAPPRSQVAQVSHTQIPKQQIAKPNVQTVQKVVQSRQPAMGIKSALPAMQQPLQRTVILSPPSATNSKSMETIPPLAPMQLAMSSSNEPLPLPQVPIMSLPSFQSTVSESSTNSASTLGDGAAPTYMLVTIDEAGNVQPYSSQSLISYDGSDQTGQTIYIDGLESSGELDNIILTIGNSSSLALDMGQTNTMTNVSSIYNSRAPSSSQDILAAALANTDVFQSEVSLQDTLTVVSSNRSSVMTPCVVESSVMLTSPPSSLLLPSLNRAADVSETSLTLNQPIMTPLEVPSSVVPTHAPAPISFPLDLPMTASQSLGVPLTSYTVVSDGAPRTDAMFQPSMPLLSEELDSHTTLSSNLPHSQVTYDVGQENSGLVSYTDTMQIVQDDLSQTKLIYDAQLTSEAAHDNIQCTEQSESFSRSSISEVENCPTSTMLSRGPLVITETTLCEQVSNEISNSFPDTCKPLDMPTEEHITSVSLPSILSTDAADSGHSLLPKEVDMENITVIQSTDSCSTQLPEFLQPHTTSDTTQNPPFETIETTSNLDPATGLMENDCNHDNMKTMDNVSNDKVDPQDSTVALPHQHHDENFSHVSDTIQVQNMRCDISDDIVEMSSTLPRSTDAVGEMGTTPQSMPLLPEGDNAAGPDHHLNEDESLEIKETDSQCDIDTSTNEIQYGESDR